MRHGRIGGLLALGMMAAANHAAAECLELETVPAVLVDPGTYCAETDLVSTHNSVPAILVAGDDITIDCGGMRIRGNGAASNGAAGIQSTGNRRVGVQSCTISGFHTGIAIQDGPGAKVVDNRVDGSAGRGIVVDGAGSLVRGNVVADTGGTTQAVATVGILAGGGADVIDNTVDGVVPAAAGGDAIGVRVDDGGSTIEGNRIRGVLSGRAIVANGDTAYTLLRSNHAGDADTGAAAIACDAGVAAVDNRAPGHPDGGHEGCAGVAP